MLKELLNGVVAICEDLHLTNPVITNKRTLQRRLEKELGTAISFDVKQFTMVYASDTKPCDYAVAALHGCELRDDDFVRGFGHMVKRKIMIKKVREEKWPLTPEKLLAAFDEGPQSCTTVSFTRQLYRRQFMSMGMQ